MRRRTRQPIVLGMPALHTSNAKRGVPQTVANATHSQGASGIDRTDRRGQAGSAKKMYGQTTATRKRRPNHGPIHTRNPCKRFPSASQPPPTTTTTAHPPTKDMQPAGLVHPCRQRPENEWRREYDDTSFPQTCAEVLEPTARLASLRKRPTREGERADGAEHALVDNPLLCLLPPGVFDERRPTVKTCAAALLPGLSKALALQAPPEALMASRRTPTRWRLLLRVAFPGHRKTSPDGNAMPSLTRHTLVPKRSTRLTHT